VRHTFVRLRFIWDNITTIIYTEAFNLVIASIALVKITQLYIMQRSTFISFNLTADHSIDYLLGILHDARATTVQRVANISVAELHWQYAEGWNTIGALLSHIIGITHLFRIVFIEERELTAHENEQYLPGIKMGEFIPQLITQQPISSYLADLASASDLLMLQIKQLSADQFQQKREGYDPETGCNLAWVLYHLAEDEVHHRGQISILRKLYAQIHAQTT
jgi:uncharacterized damage-inducible protein DinB